jgi:hypothetical protein
MNDNESDESNDSGTGCGFLIWLIVLFLAFYGAGWSIGNRADVAAAHGGDKLERLGDYWGGSQTLVEKKYQPPTAFADQIKEYQLGVTRNSGKDWYGLYATTRFLDLGWWTWAPFFLFGMPLIVLIPSGD